uniref:Uncharacterized protein n=1 Tax=Ixodes ricinus TaxID=34613 RepID=A0A147BF34_IXORI
MRWTGSARWALPWWTSKSPTTAQIPRTATRFKIRRWGRQPARRLLPIRRTPPANWTRSSPLRPFAGSPWKTISDFRTFRAAVKTEGS